MLIYLIFSCICEYRYLHSFPTRRSSDLASLRRQLRKKASVPLRPMEALSWHVLSLTSAPSISMAKKGRARKVLRSEEHTSELQSHSDLVCRLLLEKKKDMFAARQECMDN